MEETQTKVRLYVFEKLRELATNILIKAGFTPDDARLGSNVLLSADLRGIDSHGVARIPGYLRLLDVGRANARPKIKIVHQTPGTGVVDGDRGLGLLSGPFAMKLAMEKARNVGTGWVAVRNSNHFGIAAYHAMMALEEDMIGVAMTNASPIVSPTFSKSRLLGTNPICFAIPAGEQPPFVMDMATTTAANGKLEILQRKKEKAPLGWMQDKDGQPTDDPCIISKGGALLPLGGDRTHGSHKGYGLGAVVDILSGVLSGANYGPWVPPFVAFLNPLDNLVGEGIGHFFGAIRVDAFRPASEFGEHMDNWITTFRKAETVPGKKEVMIPGDPERITEEARRKNGIPLLEPVVENLKKIADDFNIPFSF
jgi:LDH2 family malate/lactate/ureidoglycolate dehydrogenase